MNTTAKLLIDCKNVLGEGIQWRADLQRVFWTDIYGNQLHSCAEDGSDHQFILLEDHLCAFAFIENDKSVLLGAFKDGLYWFDRTNGKRDLIKRYQQNNRTSRMNDGNLDRQGRFIVGGVDENAMNPTTDVWQIDADNIVSGDIPILLENIGCANSICFSVNGDTLYFADSTDKHIFAYDYDPTNGVLGESRVFVTLEESEGFPDGSTIDANGGLWNAQFKCGVVQQFHADGQRGTRIELPVPHATCCAIGGKDMNKMFITTMSADMSSIELAEAPLSGGLFVADINEKGLEHGFFNTNK